MSSSETVRSQIADSKKQLTEALQQFTPDEFLISGLLNFVRSRFLTLILKDINNSLKKQTSEEDIQLAQKVTPTEETAEHLIDRIWGDFHHPVFKYYHSQLQALKKEESKHRKRTVEIRKVNEKFLKIAASARNFYTDLIKHVLVQHRLGFIVPKYIYDGLDLVEDSNAIKVNTSDDSAIVKLVYLVHRSILFLGSTSRYQTLLSQFLAPEDQQNYNRALELYHYAELLLPAFGETRNQFGMIYDAQGDKISALHEFLRSSLSRIPSNVGLGNYKSIMGNVGSFIESLNRARLENKITTKNQQHLLATYFISLYGYYTNPDVWKRSNGFLINGTKIDLVEVDFFQIVNNIAEEGNDRFIFEKLLILLIGGINLANNLDSNTVSTLLSNLLKFTFKFINYTQVLFIELSDKDRVKAQLLLPFLRIVYSWLKVDKLALQYSQRNFEFLKATALLSNVIYGEYPNESFDSRPKREQYFDEDVGVKEFIPVGRLLSDFDDVSLFRDSDAQTRLIGQLQDHDFEEETRLRLLAVGAITRKILQSNNVGIVFDEATKLFDISGAKPVKKKQKDRPTVEQQQTEASDPTQSQSQSQSQFNTQPYSQSQYQLPSQLPTRSLPAERNKKNRRERTKKKQNTQRIQKESEIENSSPSDSSDIVQITRKTYETNYGSNYIKESDNIKSDKIITIEDLEASLTYKDENYENMVDSLVDDSFTHRPQQGISNNSIWQTPGPTAPIQNHPQSTTSSPFGNQNSPFISSQSFFPVNQQQTPQQQLYEQYQAYYQQPPQQHQSYSSPKPFPYAQFESSYGFQSPVTQVPGTPSQIVSPEQYQQPIEQSQQQQQQRPDDSLQNKYYQYK